MATKNTHRCPKCNRRAALEGEAWTPCPCGAEGRADGIGGAEWRKVKMKTPPRETRLGATRPIPKTKNGRR